MYTCKKKKKKKKNEQKKKKNNVENDNVVLDSVPTKKQTIVFLL